MPPPATPPPPPPPEPPAPPPARRATADEKPSAPLTVPSSTLRRGVFFGLLAGATPLIPLPFLDDWAWEWVRKRAAHESLKAHHYPPVPRGISILAGTEDRSWAEGCVLSVVLFPFKISLYLIKKLFRKLVIFLLVKDCADRLSRAIHETALIEHAAASGALLRSPTDGESAVDDDGHGPTRAVRRAILETLRHTDPRPVEATARKAIRGSRQLLKEASRLLGTALRTLGGGPRRPLRHVPDQAVQSDAVPLDQEEELLSSLVDSLSADLNRKSGYFQGLLEQFEAFLAVERADEPPAARSTKPSAASRNSDPPPSEPPPA